VVSCGFIFLRNTSHCSQRGVPAITLKVYNEKCAPSGFPHPTSTTAVIVLGRRCFISLQLSILHPS
jgi:hypothetical protein